MDRFSVQGDQGTSASPAIHHPPPPAYNQVQQHPPAPLQEGFHPQPHSRTSRFSLSTLSPRQKTSLNVSAFASVLSITFLYGYFGTSDESFNFNIFDDKLQIVTLALGALGSCLLVATTIVKYLMRSRTDIALYFSVAGTLLFAGHVALMFVSHGGLEVFEHVSWPFYTSMLAVIVAAISTYLNFLDHQTPQPDNHQTK